MIYYLRISNLITINCSSGQSTLFKNSINYFFLLLFFIGLVLIIFFNLPNYGYNPGVFDLIVKNDPSIFTKNLIFSVYPLLHGGDNKIKEYFIKKNIEIKQFTDYNSLENFLRENKEISIEILQLIPHEDKVTIYNLTDPDIIKKYFKMYEESKKNI